MLIWLSVVVVPLHVNVVLVQGGFYSNTAWMLFRHSMGTSADVVQAHMDVVLAQYGHCSNTVRTFSRKSVDVCYCTV